MAWLARHIKVYGSLILISLLMVFLMAISPMSNTEMTVLSVSEMAKPGTSCSKIWNAVNCCKEDFIEIDVDCNCSQESQLPEQKLSYNEQGGHKLAVLVPFRDRFDELLIFAPYIHKFLQRQKINHHIYILNQVDRYRFNRASLINVGFLLTRNTCDYIAMHDVDLLPANTKLSYAYPKGGPFHIASPEFHPRYHYPTFVGGILLINRDHFEKVNGMSNKYWGWGLEDDEFYVRLKDAKLMVSRPQNISTGSNNTFRHIHDRVHRKRDMTKCYNQREVTRRRDRETGLNNVAYKVERVNNMKIDEAPVTVINIHLSCNRQATPWCECEDFVKPNTSTHKKQNTGHKKTAR